MYGGRYKAEGDNTQLGVVIRNDNSTEPRARASVEEVYTQINEDIDLAIQLLGLRRRNGLISRILICTWLAV